jgi:hypothetical protein
MWIASLSNVTPDSVTGAAFIVGDDCMSVGEFEDDTEGYPQSPRLCEGESSSAPVVCGSELGILDICAPCLDCPGYLQLEEYLDRIRSFYDYIFALCADTDTSTIPEHPDGGIREDYTGLFAQHQASARYWDFLVHESTIKLTAQAQGQSIVAAGFYSNIADFSVGDGVDGVKLTFTFEFYENGILWDGLSSTIVESRVLDRSNEYSAQLVSETYTPTTGAADTIEVVTKSGIHPGDASLLGIQSGQNVFSDVAILFKNTNLFNDPLAEYTVEVTLVVEPTHLVPASTVTRSTIVYFKPPDPEESA